MIEVLTNPDNLVALLSLTALEIVLGVDNIVFIAIITSRLPAEKQALAYRVGLFGAMFMRIGLLLVINWVIGLTEPLVTIRGHEISGRDLVLHLGGLFLIGKSAHEIYDKVEKLEAHGQIAAKPASLVFAVIQIMLLDIVFSLDSVITAVGMVDEIAIMIAAVVAAIGVMLVFAKRIGDFVNRHPSMKILALSFLLLIGVLLVAESLDQHVNKGYIYFAMAFALLIELINMRFRKKHTIAESPHEPPPT